MKGERAIRLVVIDEQAAIRDAVRLVCDDAADLEFLGGGRISGDHQGFGEADVIVLGVSPSMGPGDVVELRSRFPGSRLVLLTEEDDDRTRRLLRAGVDAAVSKRSRVLRILDVVRSVAAGRVPLDAPSQREAPGTRLSSREREVLALLAEGRTNREIGEALGIAPRTTAAHIAAIYRKLGVSGRVEAARRALEMRPTPREPAGSPDGP